MTEEEFKEILDKEETDTVEFKSWINARNIKEIISLAVDELIAFANTKGGTVYFGVEDKPIEVTGCDRNYDGQRIIEGIYDRTVPPLFTEISDFSLISLTATSRTRRLKSHHLSKDFSFSCTNSLTI